MQRLTMLDKCLGKYSQLHRIMMDPMAEFARAVDESIAKLDSDSEMTAFVEGTVAVHGLPPEVVPFNVGLPCGGDELALVCAPSIFPPLIFSS